MCYYNNLTLFTFEYMEHNMVCEKITTEKEARRTSMLVQIALQQQHDQIETLHDRLDRAYAIIFGLRAQFDTEPYVEDWQIKQHLDEALKVLIAGVALAHKYIRQPVLPDDLAG